jgi:hypothetical protein
VEPFAHATGAPRKAVQEDYLVRPSHRMRKLALFVCLLAGGLIRAEIPFDKKSVETHVIVESDTTSIGDTQKRGQLILPDELAKIRFMEWVGASAPDDDTSKSLEISIIVEQSNPSTLHGRKTLGKRVIVRRIDSLRNVTIGDILNKLTVNFPAIEDPSKPGCNQKRENTDDDAASEIRSGVSDGCHYLALQCYSPT